jgi:hypothetical protein
VVENRTDSARPRTRQAAAPGAVPSRPTGRPTGAEVGRPRERVTPADRARYVIGGREWHDLVGGGLDALRIFPRRTSRRFSGPRGPGCRRTTGTRSSGSSTCGGRFGRSAILPTS